MFICPNKVVVIQVTTIGGSSSSTESFDVFVNDQFIGTCFSNGLDVEFGNVFIGSENSALTIDEEDIPYSSEDGYQTIPFSELILNGGNNTIEFRNIDYDSEAAFLLAANVIVKLYQIEDSKLIPLLGTIKNVNYSADEEGFSDDFDLICPIPEGLSPLYEFDTSFVIDTGNLNQVFSGSGIHKRRDVRFSFDMLDQQANIIRSDQEFLDNPLVESVSFDILDTGGNVVIENYFSGKFARSITITELDNKSIFGSYTKDFGVRIKVPNSFDGSTFTGEFYVYGNVPNITAAIPSNFGSIGSYGDILIDESGDPISGTSGSGPLITDSLNVQISLQNSLNYVNISRYDVYAFTEQGVTLPSLTELDPSAQSGFLFSKNIQVIDDVYDLKINPIGLEFDTLYYFTIVPYSDLGSGKPFSFGPSIFVAEENSKELGILQGSELQLFGGDTFSVNKFKSGSITNSSLGLLDTISASTFSTAKYLVEVSNATGFKTSSELKMVINSTEPSLIEEPINNTGQLEYFVEQVGSNFSLYVSGITGTGSYKMYKTLI